jgi:hypothetical protein
MSIVTAVTGGSQDTNFTSRSGSDASWALTPGDSPKYMDLGFSGASTSNPSLQSQGDTQDKPNPKPSGNMSIVMAVTAGIQDTNFTSRSGSEASWALTPGDSPKYMDLGFSSASTSNPSLQSQGNTQDEPNPKPSGNVNVAAAGIQDLNFTSRSDSDASWAATAAESPKYMDLGFRGAS